MGKVSVKSLGEKTLHILLSKGGLQSRDSNGTLNSDGAGNGEQELEMTESEYSRALGEPAGSSFYLIVGKHCIGHHTHKKVFCFLHLV